MTRKKLRKMFFKNEAYIKRKIYICKLRNKKLSELFYRIKLWNLERKFKKSEGK